MRMIVIAYIYIYIYRYILTLKQVGSSIVTNDSLATSGFLFPSRASLQFVLEEIVQALVITALVSTCSSVEFMYNV